VVQLNISSNYCTTPVGYFRPSHGLRRQNFRTRFSSEKNGMMQLQDSSIRFDVLIQRQRVTDGQTNDTR